jgi:hypothetical protein
MRFRKLRIAWSVVWGVAAVLLIVLWVRSYSHVNNPKITIYSRGDELSHLDSQKRLWRATSSQGAIQLSATNQNPIWQFEPTAPPQGGGWTTSLAQPKFLGFGYLQLGRSASIVFPVWFLLILCIILATCPWISHVRWRFTVRTLLIATTLLAIILGLLVSLA